MNIRESIRISWRSIRGHKLRSALTTLGIIIGIGAVIAFMIFGASFKADFIGDFTEDNEPAVLTYTMQQSNAGLALGPTPKFTEYDLQQLSKIEGVEYASPVSDLEALQVGYDGETKAGAIDLVGTTSEQFSGSEFTEGQSFKSGAAEAVITEQVNSRFDWDISTGDEITVHFTDGTTAEVTVVGIISEGTGIQSSVQSPPMVYLPADPYYDVKVQSPNTGETTRAYTFVRVGISDVQNVDEVKPRIATYLEDRSDARELKQKSYAFQVKSTSEVFSTMNSFLSQITGLITGIAAISLIVGSIGIANIMLVSVTERTREIGIMKAIGARKRDILKLFMVESVILGIIGAIFGLAIGSAGGYLGATLMDMPFAYPVEGFVLAIVVGVAVGILAGVYPAWMAVRVDPIEALRYE